MAKSDDPNVKATELQMKKVPVNDLALRHHPLGRVEALHIRVPSCPASGLQLDARDEVNIKAADVLELLIGMSLLTKVQASKWELDARTEPAPRTEPEARTEPAPRTEPAERTEPANNKIQTIKCPFCGYLLVISKETGKQTISCSKCGNVFQIE